VTWNAHQLDALLPQIWHALQLACAELHHPFRTPVLGTAGEMGCELRTVILREVQPDARLLICHTDQRSPKVRAIEHRPRVQWLFHDPREGVQIRASGPSSLHQGDDPARQAWQRTPLPSRLNYCSAQAPGTPIPDPADALPATLREGGLTVEQSESGWPNFCLIVTTVERLEFLQLQSDGHHRALFAWSGRQFDSAWLVP
jgi:pyridoxamine 5'-phosphate oxidase